MSEIRNLTINGETFYPLTHVDAIVNRSGEAGIDSEPTPGSHNLIESGGVAKILGGTSTQQYGPLDYANKVWSGDAIGVYYSSASYNGFIIPLTEGIQYTIDDVMHIVTFASIPDYGDTNKIRSLEAGTFVAQNGENYALATINLDQVTEIDVVSRISGLIGRIEDLEDDVEGIKALLDTYGYTVGGVVGNNDSPTDTSGKQIYLCSKKGKYPNFDNSLVIPADGLYYWYKLPGGWYYKTIRTERKCVNDTISPAIREMLVIGAEQKDELYITLAALDSLNNTVNIVVKKGNDIVSYYDHSDAKFGEVVEFDEYNHSGINIYAVFDKYDISPISGLEYSNGGLTENAYSEQYNGDISKYLDVENSDSIAAINESINPSVKSWCSNDNINSYIEELYIKNATSRYQNGLYIKAFGLSKNGVRFWADETTTPNVFNAFRIEVPLHQYLGNAEDGSYRVYFGSNSITPIYSYVENDVPELIGYVKFREGVDIGISGVAYEIDKNLVSDINNSQKIKKMLADDRQIVLLGDSHYGYPLPSILVDVIQGLTGIKTYNLGFGGCRMAWRTNDGSDDYDTFCFTEIADAIVSQNFTRQIAKAGIGMGYQRQVRDLQEIDITKPFQIVLNYSANDVTGGTVLGNLFSVSTGWDISDDTKRNALLSSLDRSKFNEAFIYGLVKLFNAFPTMMNIQVHNEPWRWYYNSEEQQISPFDYRNSINLGVLDYRNALKENCELMGIRYVDYANSGITNAFSLRREKEVSGNLITGVSLGGSIHMEAIGCAMIAQRIVSEIRNYYQY